MKKLHRIAPWLALALFVLICPGFRLCCQKLVLPVIAKPWAGAPLTASSRTLETAAI
jgi:hypothetical protein